jgi:predicted nuclease with TOPRIM domain
LHRVSFVLPLYFHAIVLVLIDCSILEELALSGKQCARRADELAQVVKNAELDVLVKSQAEKISELETAYADLKHEKDNVTTGYQRLAAKHDAFKEKVEREKQSLREAHTTEVAKLHGDLYLETHSYTEYHQTVRCRPRELHEIVASSFDEIQM